MEFLDNIFDKIGNEIEWGTKRVVSAPGQVTVDILDTVTGQNNPLNPVGLIGNAIRSGIGSAGLKGEGLGVLTRERDSEGNIRSGAMDYFALKLYQQRQLQPCRAHLQLFLCPIQFR